MCTPLLKWVVGWLAPVLWNEVFNKGLFYAHNEKHALKHMKISPKSLKIAWTCYCCCCWQLLEANEKNCEKLFSGWSEANPLGYCFMLHSGEGGLKNQKFYLPETSIFLQPSSAQFYVKIILCRVKKKRKKAKSFLSNAETQKLLMWKIFC